MSEFVQDIAWWFGACTLLVIHCWVCGCAESLATVRTFFSSSEKVRPFRRGVNIKERNISPDSAPVVQLNPSYRGNNKRAA